RDRNPDLIEDLSRHLRAEKIHNLLVHCLLRLELPDHGYRGSVPCPSFPRKRESRLFFFSWVPACAGTSGCKCLCSVLRRLSSVVRYSAASATSPPRCCLELCKSTLRPSERISFTSTLNDSGMPDSNASSPRTIDS